MEHMLYIKLGVGIAFIVILTLFNIIKSRKMTVAIAILIQSLTILTVLLNTWLSIGVAVGFVALLYIRYQRRFVEEEVSYLDYNDKVLSVSGAINKLEKRKDKEVVIGEILPTNYKELKLNNKKIGLSDDTLSGHTLVTGASGSGKSYLIKSIMNQRIKDGYSIAFFDYKGEKDIVDHLRSIANALNVEFYEFSIDTCDFCYDPLINLNETGKLRL